MNQIVMKRPTGVTITAWLWIMTGGLMALSSLFGAFTYSMMRQMGPLPPATQDMPAGFAVMAVLFQHFGVLLLIQGVLAVLAVWAGINLLRLKAWARTAIEALSWLAFIYCVGFGVFWVYMWVSMTGQMPKGGAHIDTDSFQIGGAVMGVVITAVFAVPFWIMIRYLRGEEVHASIANAQPIARTRLDILL